MMKSIKDTNQDTVKAIISNRDFRLLEDFISRAEDGIIEPLAAKLRTMELVDDHEPMPQSVGLNQKITLLDAHTNRVMQIQLVLPEESDIKQKKVSVLTPIGIALLGERKQERVMWPIGGGYREVTIMEIGSWV